MKYAICNEVYGDLPLADACQHAYASGYEGIEIAPFTLGEHVSEVSPDRRRMLRETIHGAGLQTVGLHWLLAGTEGLHVTSNDAAVQERTLMYLSELTRLCRDLGGSILVLGSPKQRNLAAGMSLDEGRKIAISMLERLLPDLEAQQVTIAIEPLGPEETDFINTARQAVELIEALDSEWIRLQLDVKAMSTEPQSCVEIIRQNADWLTHFHANDPNRQGPGMGLVQFESIMNAIREIDYQGWVSVEVFDMAPGVEALTRGSIEYLKRIEHSLNDRDC